MKLYLDQKPFPKNVLEQAAIASRIKTASFLSRRLDLRGKTVVAFSENAENFAECAFSLKRNFDGWSLGVHIADVCEYVIENSPLDIEALNRAARISDGITTIEMLPKNIVSDLCSLSSKGDKLAVSVLLEIDNNGELRSVEVEESIIRVACSCIYREVDQLALSTETSSVMQLREKYSPFMDILSGLYEFSAILYDKRRKKNGLDCSLFRKAYGRDSDGNIISFCREPEPDSRVMLREIGYFVGEAVGNHMLSRNIPCIFIGQSPAPEYALNYLGKLVGETNAGNDNNRRCSDIANLAKGSQYYEFVCESLADSLPRADFSEKPIYNIFCNSDRMVSFFRPASRYTDLLTLRSLKTCVAAKGSATNLNPNRQRQIIAKAVYNANESEKYVFEAQKHIAKLSALQYLENSGTSEVLGFPLLTDESGSVLVITEYGLMAIVPAEYAIGFDFEPANPFTFEIIAFGTEEEYSVLKPKI